MTTPLSSPFGAFADNGVQDKHLGRDRSSRQPGKINLKAVAEVLIDHGLDPTEEIVKILRPTDEHGNALPCALDEDVQVRIFAELLSYTQPKLRSIDVKASVAVSAFNVDDSQATRIAEEFLRAQAAGLE